jgi:hypothetical protein
MDASFFFVKTWSQMFFIANSNAIAIEEFHFDEK